MPHKRPSEKASGKKNQLIEKLHQQFDPPERFPVEPEDAGPKRSQKQPGQDLHDSQKDSDDGE